MTFRNLPVLLLAMLSCGHAQDTTRAAVPVDPLTCPLIELEASKIPFAVYLHTGEVLEGSSILCRDGFLSRQMRIRIGDRPIYPAETDSIRTRDAVGIPAPDPREWAFRIVTGRISVYASRPSRKLSKATWLSKDSEPLVRYSLKNLEARMRDKPEAAGLVRRKRNARVLGPLMGVAGVGLTTAGIITSVHWIHDANDDIDNPKIKFEPNFLFFSGVGLVAGCWIPWAMTRNNPEQALALYNAP